MINIMSPFLISLVTILSGKGFATLLGKLRVSFHGVSILVLLILWQDNWLGEGPIDNLLQTHSIDTLKVKQLRKDDTWDITKFYNIVPISYIQKNIQISFISHYPDHILFKISSSRNFMLKDLWDVLRSKNNINIVLNKIVLVDNILCLKGFYLPSICQCYFYIDYLKHVFLNDPIAVRMWNWFDDFLNSYLFNVNLFVKHILQDILIIS